MNDPLFVSQVLLPSFVYYSGKLSQEGVAWGLLRLLAILLASQVHFSFPTVTHYPKLAVLFPDALYSAL